MENNLYELTRRRRSVRRYGNKHIDDKVIHEIMKVAGAIIAFVAAFIIKNLFNLIF